MSILGRVSDAWASLLGRPTTGTRDIRNEMASINRELAEVKLELADTRQALNSCRRREENANNSGSSLHDPADGLFAELAMFLSQLRMLAALMESGREITGKNVVLLVNQLVEAMERSGLEPISGFGKEMPFDEQLCESLTAGTSFYSEEPVVVRFVGYRYKGLVIRKALVERPH